MLGHTCPDTSEADVANVYQMPSGACMDSVSIFRKCLFSDKNYDLAALFDEMISHG